MLTAIWACSTRRARSQMTCSRSRSARHAARQLRRGDHEQQKGTSRPSSWRPWAWHRGCHGGQSCRSAEACAGGFRSSRSWRGWISPRHKVKEDCLLSTRARPEYRTRRTGQPGTGDRLGTRPHKNIADAVHDHSADLESVEDLAARKRLVGARPRHMKCHSDK